MKSTAQKPATSATAKFNVAVLVAKTAVAATLIGFLFAYGLIDLKELQSIWRQREYAILASLLFFVTLPLSAVRWWLLLRAQSVHISCGQSFRIVAIGQFFNTFMPGSVGGDAVRFYYLLGATTEKRAAAATSLVLDRFLGLAGLLIVTGLVILLDPADLTANAALRSLAQGIATLCAVAIAASAVMLAVPDAVFRGVVRPIRGWGHAGAFVYEGLKALAVYRRRKLILSAGLALSILIQFSTIAGFVSVATIFALPVLTWLDYAIASSLSLIANMLPFSPGGIGIGEGTFGFICRLMSGNRSAPYATIFFAVRALSAFVSLYGAFAWASSPRLPKQ